jgi:hypothetical protein
MEIKLFIKKDSYRNNNTILFTLEGFVPCCNRGGDWVLGSVGGTIFSQGI